MAVQVERVFFVFFVLPAKYISRRCAENRGFFLHSTETSNKYFSSLARRCLSILHSAIPAEKENAKRELARKEIREELAAAAACADDKEERVRRKGWCDSCVKQSSSRVGRSRREYAAVPLDVALTGILISAFDIMPKYLAGPALGITDTIGPAERRREIAGPSSSFFLYFAAPLQPLSHSGVSLAVLRGLADAASTGPGDV